MSKDKPIAKKNDTTVADSETQFSYYEECRLNMQRDLGRSLTKEELYQCFMMSVVKKNFDDPVSLEGKILGDTPRFDHNDYSGGDGGTSS